MTPAIAPFFALPTEHGMSATYVGRKTSASALQSAYGAATAQQVSAKAQSTTVIDTDIDARARRLDDVYLSPDAKNALARAGSGESLADRAAGAIDRTQLGMFTPGGSSVADNLASVLGDMLAFASKGLTEVDGETAAAELEASVADALRETLSGHLRDAGFSQEQSDAVAGQLAESIATAAEAGETVLRFGLTEAVQTVAERSTAAIGTGFGGGFGGGSLALATNQQAFSEAGVSLAISIDVATGDIAVDHTAVVSQSFGQSAVAMPAAPAGAQTPTPVDSNGLSGLLEDFVQGSGLSDDPNAASDALRAFLGPSADLGAVDTARLVAGLLESVAERNSEAEDDAAADEADAADDDAEALGSAGDDEDAVTGAVADEQGPIGGAAVTEPADANGDRRRVTLTVPLPALATAVDESGVRFLLFGRPDDSLGAVRLPSLNNQL